MLHEAPQWLWLHGLKSRYLFFSKGRIISGLQMLIGKENHPNARNSRKPAYFFIFSNNLFVSNCQLVFFVSFSATCLHRHLLTALHPGESTSDQISEGSFSFLKISKAGIPFFFLFLCILLQLTTFPLLCCLQVFWKKMFNKSCYCQESFLLSAPLTFPTYLGELPLYALFSVNQPSDFLHTINRALHPPHPTPHTPTTVPRWMFPPIKVPSS